ncbi:RAMP superfamily CRISPR-associated protein [Nostoc sp.]|uniref:RAMP superfamily CRISPR-associated protein n=1 Tax=Nostoc sp. TaxID=1180 RepID=UPI002FFCE030
MIRGLGDAATKLGITVENKTSKGQPPGNKGSKPQGNSPAENNWEQIPMMYRAQVSGRCSLQFAGNNKDLERWRDEWVYPSSQNNNQLRYQRREPQLGLDGEIYRIKIQFPFRLSSNCGQDSILRPVLGKNGIPLIPGSSIKGLFRRACSPQEATRYCGDDKELTPGSLRFHNAYPIDDWAGTKKVKVGRPGEEIFQTRYRIVDVIHPQQKRQVEGEDSPKALAMISLYQPTLIFELSSTDPNVKWEEIETILKQAVQQGVGGKTSTGYGLGGYLPNQAPILPNYPLSIYFKGVGVSPLLRSDEPEFRPNLFKATLRGHVRRLLGGVCNNEKAIKQSENSFFGSSEAPGIAQIFWESQGEIYNAQDSNPTYETAGVLHISASQTDLRFIEWVIKFAFVMGGFGKSWRRVFHKNFYPEYVRRRRIHIGCHWESTDSNLLNIKTSADLQNFLEDLYKICCQRLASRPPQAMDWRESWHPKRVAVYCKLVNRSEVVELFHNETFKTTPAIGGRNEGDKRPFFVSSVWHRMLPIDGRQYLEIVTVFHGDRTSNSPWRHRTQGNQLQPFIESLDNAQLNLTWGTRPVFDT